VQKFKYTVWSSPAGKRVSELMDAILSEGDKLLKVQKLGEGKDTRNNNIPCLKQAFTLFSYTCMLDTCVSIKMWQLSKSF
jgi:hypothetical protein